VAPPDKPWEGIEVFKEGLRRVQDSGFTVIVGEFGPLTGFSTQENHDFVLQVINYCMLRDIGFLLWSYRNDHYQMSGFYDGILLESEFPTELPPVFTCLICGLEFSNQAALDAHILTEHPEPPVPSGCITAFLLSSMGLSTLLPYLRLFRSHLPRITVKTYYNTSNKIMGVINCLE